MEKCPTCEADDSLAAVCDFCQHYEFNGEDATLDGKFYKGAIYVGKGQCEHPEHPRAEEPESGCDDFKCFRIKPIPTIEVK